ncbi:M61 family metallopeptidase [Qipengyuania sp.]|uniref:M61 family metallopeptidase n=1 Tax=Qipengyuania sp. TaxID=2004515 RepID=UPI0035C8086F
MKTKVALIALAAALLTQPVAAQVTRTEPVQQALDTEVAVPADTAWPGGPIALDIDATDTRRGIYTVKQTIPVPAGMNKLTLLFPEWLPGNHAARGPINLISRYNFTAGGKTMTWMRNPLNVYQIDVIVPEGAREVVAEFVHTSPITGSEGRITMTREMLNLQWEKMSFYPAGYYTRRIAFQPKVTFPDGWQVFTALDGMNRSGNTVTWDTVDYETLVDSPIFAGKYAKQWSLDDDVKLDVVADKPSQLKIEDKNLKTFEKLIDEADVLFGQRHFDHYDILLALTDRMGGIGLEHQRSAENQYEPDSFVKWDEMDWDHNVVAHELVHSWNGKYRRPEDLWTPDYRTPMQDSLLWVYEGQTQFWGWVLAARSGLQKKETVLGQFANAVANYAEGQPGREWRSVADTTNDPIINARRPVPFSSLNRSEDYYVEGALTWLEADQIIRKGTGGKKGLDDFARRFFGAIPGDMGINTYDFDEVVRELNAVYPYDWATFLDTRLRQPNQPAPMKGVEMAGYRLVWKDTPNPYNKGRMSGGKYLDLFYSLGMNLNKSGKVTGTLWDGPAFNAGIVNGAEIVAVNGEAYSDDAMKDAVTAAAKEGAGPIALLVKRGDRFDTIEIDYDGGLRYPWLEPVSSGTQPFDRLLAARTAG